MNFTFDPPQSSLRDLYAACDVWLTASSSEGFNLPAMEAMACRTPVVATRTGWPAEAIVDGVNGACVGIDDVEALARETERLLRLSDKAGGRFRTVHMPPCATAPGNGQQTCSRRRSGASRRPGTRPTRQRHEARVGRRGLYQRLGRFLQTCSRLPWSEWLVQMSEGSGTGPIAYLINQYPKVSHSFIRQRDPRTRAPWRRGAAVRNARMGWPPGGRGGPERARQDPLSAAAGRDLAPRPDSSDASADTCSLPERVAACVAFGAARRPLARLSPRLPCRGVLFAGMADGKEA